MPKNLSIHTIVPRDKAKFLKLAYKLLHNLIPATLASMLPFFLAMLPLIFESWLMLFPQPITPSSQPSPSFVSNSCLSFSLVLPLSRNLSYTPSHPRLPAKYKLSAAPWYSQSMCTFLLIAFITLCYPWPFWFSIYH